MFSQWAKILGLIICHQVMAFECSAETTVSTEIRYHERPDFVGDGLLFNRPFESIPNLSDADFANFDLGNAFRIETRNGRIDHFSAEIDHLFDGFLVRQEVTNMRRTFSSKKVASFFLISLSR